MKEQITYPVITREETEDGWIMTFDHGPKLGKGTALVHRGTRDDDARAELKRFLASLGYALAEG